MPGKRSMTGETNLGRLLESADPRLMEGEFVFCTFPAAEYGHLQELQPVASISEPEGLTLVVPRSVADRQGLGYESVFRRIILMVHSSLDAVGLTSALSASLAEHGIAANVVAGYYHDHIFVGAEVADRALGVLADLSG
mgnify:CR=1 FL=1